jgi:hypothetical protein
MPIFKRDDVELYYEEHGAGFPVLLIAPGGMRSAVSFWERTPWNPIEQLAPHYRVIAMDQRNAGKSVAPIRATDSWHVYTADQVALLDHPGGLDDNRQAFFEMFDSWANELRLARPEVSATTWESFKQSMYGGDFLFNVSREFVSRCQTPLLVLLGNDLHVSPVRSSVPAISCSRTGRRTSGRTTLQRAEPQRLLPRARAARLSAGQGSR